MRRASPQSFATYLESSGSDEAPRGSVGPYMQGERPRLRAGRTLNGIAIESDPEQRSPGGSTEVIPNLRSSLVVAKHLNLETKVSFAECNADTDTTLDTRLRYRKPLDTFFNELDGSGWRTPDCLTKEVLRLGFRQIFGEGGVDARLAITGAAIFEAVQSPDALADSSVTRRLGFAPKITGLTSPFPRAKHWLSLKLEKTAGTRTERTGTLAYDESWRLGSLLQLGFTLKLLRGTEGIGINSCPSTSAGAAGFDGSWRRRGRDAALRMTQRRKRRRIETSRPLDSSILANDDNAQPS